MAHRAARSILVSGVIRLGQARRPSIRIWRKDQLYIPADLRRSSELNFQTSGAELGIKGSNDRTREAGCASQPETQARTRRVNYPPAIERPNPQPGWARGPHGWNPGIAAGNKTGQGARPVFTICTWLARPDYRGVTSGCPLR